MQIIVKNLTKLIEAGAAGLVYFPDHDEAGEKKGELVTSACQQVSLPCLILEPTDILGEMPPKGDITDFVEAHLNCNINESIGRLEKAVAIAIEADELQRIEREEEERLASLPNWSQSDIAQWLVNKYKGKLAWNTAEQEWYRYGAATKGIWSIEPDEFVGQLVNRELEKLVELIAQTSKNKKKPSYTIIDN